MSPQESIGHYRIIAKLGEGGMGAVYRAADTKLNREVAIKVLPDTLANDPDYLARSTREAQVLASLNHPNIAIIYGVEERALVMELVPGQTLEERIAGGPIPLEEALDIARQIAEALDAAHEKGVIHRDLKPANVKVTPEGVVKVLDFGLAKAMDPVSPVSTANSPTLTMRATQVGIIMGTAGYMAPEQAAGKPVDRRADIWSFGVLLYEMLTGARLFDDGESISHTLADVLRREIDFSRLSPGTPPAIRQLLQRCLDRKLRTRLQHIGEARIAIETAASNPRAADEPRRSAPVLWMAATAVCLAAAVAGWVAWTRKTVPPSSSAKFELPIRGGDLALSPDGKTLAYLSSDGGGVPSIYLRPLDSLESKPLAGTAGAVRPFWSPDGKSLAYGASGKLYRVDVAGGVPTRICDLPGFAGGTWSDQGVILAAVDAVGLVRVTASGGAPPTLVLKLPSPSVPIVFPQFLPGGSQFLYMRLGVTAQRGAYLASLDGQPGTRILDAQYRVVYDSNSGRLLYGESNGAVMARHLDLNPPALTGDAVTVAEQVRVNNSNRNLEASVSTNGILCYVRGSEVARTAFAWRDRSGKLLATIGQPVEVIGSFDISPDQKRLAYTSGPQEKAVIWIMDLTGGLTTRVTFNDGAITPRWSSDGKYVYYRSHGLARKAADGSGEEEILNPGREEALGPGILSSLSADGKFALVGQTAVSLVPLIPGGKAEPLVDNKARAGNASFSPDGRWIAYNSDESGRNEIHVQGFPDRRGKWVISSDGGMAPQWRADGKELYWVSREGMLTAAPIELGSVALRSGRPVPLFALPQVGNFRAFRPGPDGSKFLTYEPERESSQTQPGVVVHIGWSSSLPK